MKLNRNIKRKLAQYFKQRLGMYDYRRGWMKGTCPYCGRDKKYGVNIENNRTHCFRCNVRPNPIQVIIELEVEVSNYAEALHYLQAFDGADYLETPQEYLPEKDTILPEGYSSIVIGNGRLGKAARSYMKSRGFDVYDLAMRGVGYCKKGKYFGRIIVPFYEKGQLVYFNARKFMGGGRKFDNPQIEEFGIGKSMLIYNVDALHIYNRIYVVESATNALTLGENSIGGGGKVFSSYQISKILQSKATEIVIILDPDAYKEAIQLAMALINHKKIKLVRLPEKLYIRSKKKAISKVDVNEIGRKRTMRYVKKSPWLQFQDLMKLKMDYETTAKYSYN